MRILRTSVLLTAVLLASSALVATPAAATPLADHYIDCSAASNGTGTSDSPWNALTAANTHGFTAGDRILFKRGTTCTGMFAPTGSGAAGNPVLVDAYGKGAKPAIDGAGQRAALELFNVEQWEVRNLDISNGTLPASANRRGISVRLQSFPGAVADHIVIENVDVHDVWGTHDKFGAATGGIIFDVDHGTAASRFNDVRIADNTVARVDREGIYFWSDYCSRPELGTYWGPQCPGAWSPATGIRVTGNTLKDIYGDGIVPKTSVGAIVDHNRVSGFNLRATTYNAGIWSANTDDALFEFNEVSGGKTTLDGMALDVDHASHRTIFQYNYSHDNEGGFLLVCGTNGTIDGAKVRYNLSVNDRFALIQSCDGSGQVEIYNNTLSTGAGTNVVALKETTSAALDLDLSNNIFRNYGGGAVSWQFNDSRISFDRNLFSGVPTPAGATNSVTGYPMFSQSTGTLPAAFRLCQSSPAIGAGAVIPQPGSQDYFGNAIPATPNIGFFQGAALAC